MKTETRIETHLITDAPECYDGFGTYTRRIIGMRKRRFVREVGVMAEHVDWQTQRYSSGLYLAMTPDHAQMCGDSVGIVFSEDVVNGQDGVSPYLQVRDIRAAYTSLSKKMNDALDVGGAFYELCGDDLHAIWAALYPDGK